MQNESTRMSTPLLTAYRLWSTLNSVEILDAFEEVACENGPFLCLVPCPGAAVLFLDNVSFDFVFGYRSLGVSLDPVVKLCRRRVCFVKQSRDEPSS